MANVDSTLRAELDRLVDLEKTQAKQLDFTRRQIARIARLLDKKCMPDRMMEVLGEHPEGLTPNELFKILSEQRPGLKYSSVFVNLKRMERDVTVLGERISHASRNRTPSKVYGDSTMADYCNCARCGEKVHSQLVREWLDRRKTSCTGPLFCGDCKKEIDEQKDACSQCDLGYHNRCKGGDCGCGCRKRG